MNILEEIAAKRAEDLVRKKQEIPLAVVERQAKKLAKTELESQGKFPFPFRESLKKGQNPARESMRFICEVKKASPSKGIIAEEFPYLAIAGEYEQAGAAAISVLTEPHYFLGSDDYLKEIAAQVKIPVLRKDFTIDAYQIYEAKLLGASAVLLICALLEDAKLKEFIETAHELGLSALVEAHDETEVQRAVAAGAQIIGVNNRNLKDFTVDIRNSVHLRALAPKGCLLVAESGIKTAEDVAMLKENGVDAVLIGETLMRASDKRAMLQELGDSIV